MCLASASSDPQLVKCNILQYYKGLLAPVKNNHILVEQSFYSILLGHKDLKHHSLQPRDFIIGKTSSKKLSSTSLERPLLDTGN